MTVQKSDNARHSGADPTTSGPTSDRTGSGRWLGLMALLPIACCGVPLLLAAGVTAGTGAVLGGVAGIVLLVAALVLTAVILRRRAVAHRTAVGGPTKPGRSSCC